MVMQRFVYVVPQRHTAVLTSTNREQEWDVYVELKRARDVL
jgi:hypothetical protein